MRAPPDRNLRRPTGIALPVALLFLLLSTRLYGVGATEIIVTPEPLWTPTFNAANLSGLAGTDFTSTQSSAANQGSISVQTLTAVNKSWIVYVRKTDISWPAGLTLWIRRTGNGTTSILGGTIDAGSLNVWRLIAAADTELFRGSRVRYNVPAQLEVRNLSVLMGAGSYTTIVTFTVTEL